MGIAVIVIIVACIAVVSLVKAGLKAAAFIIFAAALGVSIYICSSQPQMHKPFSLNTIEYLFKINKDGSVTTTKQVTQTLYKEQAK